MNKQKRLLILGGSRFIIPAITAAHKQGYYVITCDYLPENPGHKYADEYHNVSIIDKEAILNLAKTLNIDGIISFATDPGVVTAAWVSEQLGLPTSPYESIQILQNKALFRNFLTEHGFNVPKAKGYCDIETAINDIEEFTFPIIVKPVDSAGSKGVTRVDSVDNLEDAISYALGYSPSKEFIIEEFIQTRGYSSDTDCFSINGELVFCSFNSQRFDAQATNPYVPSAYSWPALMDAKDQAELKHEIQRLLHLLHMGTTIYNVETRVGIDGKAYIMEVSPRGGGNRLSELLKIVTGQDLITSCVRTAVGDSVESLHNPTYKGYFAEYIIHSDKAGVFQEMVLDEEFANTYLYETDLWVKKGDEIGTFSGANEAIGTLILQFPSADEMEEQMKSIKDHVHLYVTSTLGGCSTGGGGVSVGTKYPNLPISDFNILFSYNPLSYNRGVAAQ